MKQLVLILLLFANSALNCAFAEIYNCNGTWINKPCEEKILGKITETKRVPRTTEEITSDQKKLIIHDLQTLKFNADRESGLNFVISDVMATCNDASASLEDCTKKASEKVDSINKSLTDIEVSNIKSKAKETAVDPKQNVVIAVTDNRSSYLDRYDRYDWYRPNRPNRIDSPILPKTPITSGIQMPISDIKVDIPPDPVTVNRHRNTHPHHSSRNHRK